jgi:hypothetical protein
MSLAPCHDFWPANEQHGVRYVDLVGEPQPSVTEAMPLLAPLAAMTDALHSLQSATGEMASAECAETIEGQIALELEQLADSQDDTGAAALRTRAAAFRGEITHAAASRAIAADRPSGPLFVLCGPLSTWRPKTRAPLHSLIVALKDAPNDDMVQALDASIPAAAAELQALLDLPSLTFSPLYPMTVTDLVVCAGESNCHPKHYAYFLPEDQGVPDVPDDSKHTLAFRNAYVERHLQISQPLADELLDGPTGADEAKVERALLSWLRGHDVSHAARVDVTDYAWHDGLGHEPFMMLQEALADVYGYLLTVTSTWRGITDLTPLDCATAFLTESLHYVRRGPWHYGDSGAAYLELSYLAANHFVDVEADGTIRWTLEGLHAGMRSLAVELGDAILKADHRRSPQRLILKCGWPAPTPALQVLAALRWELASVPTTVGYNDARHTALPASRATRGAAALASLVDWSAPVRARGLRAAG